MVWFGSRTDLRQIKLLFMKNDMKHKYYSHSHSHIMNQT